VVAPRIHPFATLRTVDPREVALQNDLLRRLPGRDVGLALRQAVLEAVTTLQGRTPLDGVGDLAAQIAVHRMGPMATEPDPFLGSPRVRAELRLAGVGAMAWVETTLGAARELLAGVAREMGAEAPRASEVLTSFEAGVIEYLLGAVTGPVSQAVAGLAAWGPVTVGHVSLEPDDPDLGPSGPEGFLSLLGRVPLAGVITPFRLLIPRAVLPGSRRRGHDASRGTSATTASSSEPTASRSSRGPDPAPLLDRLATTPIPMSVEVARTRLHPEDVTLLTAGARVEVDPVATTDVDAVADLASGAPLVLVQSTARRATARVHGTLVHDGSRAGLRVTRIEIDDPTRSHLMTDPDAAVVDAANVSNAANAANDTIDTGVDADPSAVAPATAPDAVPGAAPTLADDVLVELRVELSRITLNLGELAALRAGEVIPLGVVPDGRVALVAGDQVVASGELVVHDGRLAVEITGGPA